MQLIVRQVSKDVSMAHQWLSRRNGNKHLYWVMRERSTVSRAQCKWVTTSAAFDTTERSMKGLMKTPWLLQRRMLRAKVNSSTAAFSHASLKDANLLESLDSISKRLSIWDCWTQMTPPSSHRTSMCDFTHWPFSWTSTVMRPRLFKVTQIGWRSWTKADLPLPYWSTIKMYLMQPSCISCLSTRKHLWISGPKGWWLRSIQHGCLNTPWGLQTESSCFDIWSSVTFECIEGKKGVSSPMQKIATLSSSLLVAFSARMTAERSASSSCVQSCVGWTNASTLNESATLELTLTWTILPTHFAMTVCQLPSLISMRQHKNCGWGFSIPICWRKAAMVIVGGASHFVPSCKKTTKNLVSSWGRFCNRRGWRTNWLKQTRTTGTGRTTKKSSHLIMIHWAATMRWSHKVVTVLSTGRFQLSTAFIAITRVANACGVAIAFPICLKAIDNLQGITATWDWGSPRKAQNLNGSMKWYNYHQFVGELQKCR